MDDAKLIERLRRDAEACREFNESNDPNLYDEAADAVERLTAERDALNEEADSLREQLYTDEAMVEGRRRAEADRDRLAAALREVQAIQPAMLETFRSLGVVFDGPLGNDPSNWEHVAFSVYNRLCEVESIASAALAAVAGKAEA